MLKNILAVVEKSKPDNGTLGFLIIALIVIIILLIVSAAIYNKK
ncbi:MAG: hypothetical protein WDA12_00870 [Bacilli bacterium]